MSDKRRTTKSCLELQEVDGIANKPVQVHNIDHIINDDVQVRESFVAGRSSSPPPEQSRGEQSNKKCRKVDNFHPESGHRLSS